MGTGRGICVERVVECGFPWSSDVICYGLRCFVGGTLLECPVCHYRSF